MKKITRLIFAVVVILSGATLIPVMGLPVQGFSWQLYAEVYTRVKVFLPMILR